MEREGVQNMIDLAIANFHAENVARLTKIEQRIIGIDGNGTGKKGALQRQDAKLEELACAQKDMGSKLDTIIHQTNSWDKATVWEALKWMFGTILVILALILSYLGYRASQHSKEPIAQHASLSSTQTAGAE